MEDQEEDETSMKVNEDNAEPDATDEEVNEKIDWKVAVIALPYFWLVFANIEID